MASDVIMVDCIAANIPAVKASRFANNPAQLYVTGGGIIEASEHQILEFPRHIRTCQSPIIGVDDVSNAREMDVETWAASAEHWPDFYNTRTDQDRATCYCSLVTVPAVIAACRDAGIRTPPRWRLAWWWRNIPGVPLSDLANVPAPTVVEVLAELARVIGHQPLAADEIWGCQYANYARWDLSIIYGVPDFARK